MSAGWWIAAAVIWCSAMPLTLLAVWLARRAEGCEHRGHEIVEVGGAVLICRRCPVQLDAHELADVLGGWS